MPDPRVPVFSDFAFLSTARCSYRVPVLLRIPLVLAAAALVLAGCSGPPQAGDGGTTTTDRGPSPNEREARDARRMALAEVETFDVSRYPTPAPTREVDVRHQVPSKLLQGRADEGVTQTIEGFRVQVYSAQDKQSAEEFREQVRQWWSEAKTDAPSDLFREPLPIVVEYGQPYYRVRVGAFASREAASEALSYVQQEFADAFVARSTVKITR